MILAGDIGGTNTRLALAEMHAGRITIIVSQDFRSQLYDDLIPIVSEFLSVHQDQATPISAACFAVAGPVEGDTARVTNLPWQLDAARLAEQLGLPFCKLINDFQGTGYGLEQLSFDDMITLQTGAPEETGVRVLLGAGTGLGVGIAVYRQGHYEILPSEGGHVDFAPSGEEEVALLRYWQEKERRVSCEMILSGQGLARIYEYVRHEVNPVSGDDLLTMDDPAAAISEAALGGDPVATRALEMFIKIYAAQAGNLALICLARGGVYLAGGIAPKIIDRLQGEAFVTAFRDKAPMHDLLATIPLKVIMNTRVGLLGAAAFAHRYSPGS